DPLQAPSSPVARACRADTGGHERTEGANRRPEAYRWQGPWLLFIRNSSFVLRTLLSIPRRFAPPPSKGDIVVSPAQHCPSLCLPCPLCPFGHLGPLRPF